MRAAVRKMNMVWMRNELTSVLRRSGVKTRWKREKKKDPRMKEATEKSDLAHP